MVCARVFVRACVVLACVCARVCLPVSTLQGGRGVLRQTEFSPDHEVGSVLPACPLLWKELLIFLDFYLFI